MLLRVCSMSLLKTLWGKEKLLVTSNFSFSHSVFCLFGELSFIFIESKIAIGKLVQFVRVQNSSCGKRLTLLPSDKNLDQSKEENESDSDMEICLGKYRRHSGKGRKLWLPAFSLSSPFSAMVSKIFIAEKVAKPFVVKISSMTDLRSIIIIHVRSLQIRIDRADLRTGGRWFDPRLGQYSFRGFMIVIPPEFILLPPLSVVWTMVMWESSQWLVKNIVRSTA